MTTDPRPLALIVLSGGMDSATAAGLYDHLDYRLLCVSVDYGQRHRRELAAARKIAGHYFAEHLVIDLSGVGHALTGSALTDPDVAVPEGHYAEDSMKATVVPNRNMLLASAAAAIGISRGAECIVMGMHAGDHAVYPDCRPEFFEALDRCIQVANEGFAPPRVDAPFITISKTAIAVQAAELDVPLHLTWSCYQGGEQHCGVCGTCYERREAFRDAGLPDPTRYLDSTTLFAEPRP